MVGPLRPKPPSPLELNDRWNVEKKVPKKLERLQNINQKMIKITKKEIKKCL